METIVYVDVLLVLNYIVNLLIILCTAKLGGIFPQRRRIVAAALLGSICSLTIFLPFMGLLQNLIARAAISALMVRVAFRFSSYRSYLWQWFIFFAVSFFFAGSMLAVWITLSPHGMIYFNGIVYFHISSLILVATSVMAYMLLVLWERISKKTRLSQSFCRLEIYMGGKMCHLTGLMDSGNALTEPFSGAPVVVCSISDIEDLLPRDFARAARLGDLGTSSLGDLGISLRLIPYASVGKEGLLPAFIPDKLIVHSGGKPCLVSRAYIGISPSKIGGEGYNALLSPEIILLK